MKFIFLFMFGLFLGAAYPPKTMAESADTIIKPRNVGGDVVIKPKKVTGEPVELLRVSSSTKDLKAGSVTLGNISEVVAGAGVIVGGVNFKTGAITQVKFPATSFIAKALRVEQQMGPNTEGIGASAITTLLNLDVSTNSHLLATQPCTSNAIMNRGTTIFSLYYYLNAPVPITTLLYGKFLVKTRSYCTYGGTQGVAAPVNQRYYDSSGGGTAYGPTVSGNTGYVTLMEPSARSGGSRAFMQTYFGSQHTLFNYVETKSGTYEGGVLYE